MIVLDASAAFALARKTVEGRALFSLMRSGELVGAPSLLFSELGNALWKNVRAGRLSRDDARRHLLIGCGYVDEVYPDQDLAVEALALAVKHGHPTYDMLYLVLARRLDATLFTLDRALAELCAQEGVNCIETVGL